MSHRKDLAAALLEEHAVRPEALERARREQGRSGRPLWAVLLDGGLCSEDAVFLALRRWSGAPALSEERLSGLRVPAELREVVPPELAATEGVLPLERSPDGRRVALAMVDPLAEAGPVRAALSRSGVVEIHRFLLHRGVLRRCLPRLYEPAPSRPPRPAAAAVPLSEQPTGLVRLPQAPPPDRGRQAPRRRVRGDETERLPGRAPPRRPAAITQPMLHSVERVSTVQIAPDLMDEIVRLETAPALPAAPPPPPTPADAPLGAAARAFAQALRRALDEARGDAPPGAGAQGPQGALGSAGALGPLADQAAALLSGALHDEAGGELAAAVLQALRAQMPPLAPHTSLNDEATFVAQAPRRSPDQEITPILPRDPEATRQMPMPASAETPTARQAGAPADPPSDPELVIELGEISDVGLEAYEYEEK